MKCNPYQFARSLSEGQKHLRNGLWIATLFSAGINTATSIAQTLAPQTTSGKHSNSGQIHNPPSELSTRIAAAAAARDSGDAAEVAIANERLIATALRQLANLRAIEAAYPQAVALYRSSLDFEDVSGTRIDLAMAEAQAGQFDEAIKLAQEAQSAESSDPRVDRILGSSLIQKGQYTEAVAPFTRVANTDPSIENLYALASCLLQTGKPQDKARAQAIFERMTKMAGDSGSLHVLFGRAYRDANDMPSALREFRRAVAIDPHTPHANYFLGLAQLALNEWKATPEAETAIQKEAEYFPHDYLANYMLGFLLSGERRYDEANRYLRTASEIDPSSPEPFLYLGLNAYAQDDMKRAEEMLRKAVVLTGDDQARSNYQIRRAYVDLGRILTNSGRKDEAEVFLAKARDLQNKTMEQSQQSIATIALAGGAGSFAAVMPLSRQQENASAPLLEDHTDPVASVDPATMAHSKLTAAQRTQAETQEKLLRGTLGLAYNDLATSEARRGEYPRALDYYQQAERWDNTLPGLEKNLGQCAFRAGNYPEAIRALSQALQQQPGSVSMRAMLGIAYFDTNQYAEAAKTFQPLGAAGMLGAERLSSRSSPQRDVIAYWPAVDRDWRLLARDCDFSAGAQIRSFAAQSAPLFRNRLYPLGALGRSSERVSGRAEPRPRGPRCSVSPRLRGHRAGQKR